MANFKSDVATAGTILRVSHQEGQGEITGQIFLPVGTTLVAGDTFDLFDLAPWTYLTYLRVNFPGMNAGADSGADGVLGYASEGTLLTPDPDVDAFSAAADDDTLVEGDITGTNGTVFPGSGPQGNKKIYDNDIVHVRWTADNVAASAGATEGYNIVTFFAKYERLDQVGGSYDKNDYAPAPIVLPAEPAEIVFDYNGQA